MRHIKPSSVWVSLVVILHLLWKGITCQRADYTIQVSSSVSVQEGLCVTIPCNFTANWKNTFTNSLGYWKHEKTEYIVATNDKSEDVQKTNFNLMGNPDTGNCTLTINNARKEDEGGYYYRFVETKPSGVKYNYKEIITTITVTDLTKEPVMSDLGTLISGINKTVTCSPPDNCPATSLVIQWKKSDVSGIWKKSSNITFTPSLKDDKKTITCEMTNSKGKTTQKSILLNVHGPPSIIITWEINGKKTNKEDFIEIAEGSFLTLRCSIQSTLTLNVTWTDGKNNVLQYGTGKELELRLENMTMNHTGTYTCSVMNEYVRKNTKINITVQSPPSILITWEINGKKTMKADLNKIAEGSSVTLRCSIQSTLTLNVTWTDGKNNVLQFGTEKKLELRLENVTMNHTGIYICSAMTKYIRNSTSINMTVLYPPRSMEIIIQSSKGGLYPASPQVDIDQTETLTLVCKAYSLPSSTVVWVKGEGDTGTSITSDSRVLAKINVTSKMTDVYRCLAWNVLGLREQRIQVGKIQGPAVERKTSDKISYRDIAIGFFCGMSATALLLLSYKLIKRKKMAKNNVYVDVKEPPANVETDATYMNISKPEETTDNNIQLDSRGVTSDQEDVQYSTIAFPAKPSKIPSSQPETEYAEIKTK